MKLSRNDLRFGPLLLLSILMSTTLPGQTYTVIHAFSGPDGATPKGRLLQAADGNLYGTTNAGGPGAPPGYGTIFRIDGSGNLTTIRAFTGLLGATDPVAGLIQGADGHLYGTTEFGEIEERPRDPYCAQGCGAIFGTDTSGALLMLFHFDGSGNGPLGELVLSPNGDLFGMTQLCNDAACGTVFMKEPGEPLQTLHTFSGSDGSEPFAGLILASDGNFYGTTSAGGANGLGTVFSMDAAGNVTTLHSFAGPEGATPKCDLFQAADGNFYGVTSLGGANGLGTIFSMDAAGNVTTLHDFTGTDGASPYGTLIQATDGNLYGTTYEGGASSGGTLFQISTSGDFTTLYSFTGGSDGGHPYAGLIEASDGNFYGVASTGGVSGGGVVFVWGGCSLPPSATVSGGGIVCPGNSTAIRADLVGTAPWTVSWSDGPIDENVMTTPDIRTVSPASTTTYTAVVSNACGVVPAAGSATVTLDTPPVASASGSATICAGGWARLSGSGGTGCTWSPVTGLTDPHYCSPVAGPLTTTTYSLIVTDAAGCSSTNASTVTITVDPNPAPVVTVTECPEADTSGFVASVPGSAGDSYLWTLTGGTITSGQGTKQIVFTSGNPGTRMAVQVQEANAGGCAGTATVLAQVDYADVSPADPFHDDVCAVGRAGLTAGCGDGNYCPLDSVTRAQMAVFLLKARHGAAYVPPACSGVFLDVPCPGPFADWIERLAAESITAGCGDGNYCPDAPVSRAQMAAFLLKAEHGAGYAPPACSGLFQDVACPSPFAAWIETLFAERITGGCQASPPLYCPDSPNTRGQMAVFLVKTFGSSGALLP